MYCNVHLYSTVQPVIYLYIHYEINKRVSTNVNPSTRKLAGLKITLIVRKHLNWAPGLRLPKLVNSFARQPVSLFDGRKGGDAKRTQSFYSIFHSSVIKLFREREILYYALFERDL